MTSRRAKHSVLHAVLLLLAACSGDATSPAQGALAGTGGQGASSPPSASTSGTEAGAGGGAARAGASGATAGAGGSGAPPARGGAGGTGTAGAQAGAGAVDAGSGAAGASGATAPMVKTVPTLYWLDINANRVMRSQQLMDGEVIVSRTGTAPDGVSVDVAGGKIYWTNMGSLLGTGGGSVQRANLDGSDVETIIAPGLARTPKQMQLDLANRNLYFCDREGAKVWRATMDGASPEAIVSEHGFRELVGVALDVPGGKFYFSDRIGKKILRANLEMPAGETGANRTDIEEMVVFGGNAMPIDLDIDHEHGMLYWTDRQIGTVQRAGLEIPAGQTASNRTDVETLVEGLVDTIGISLDVPNDTMYFSELGGDVSASALDGSGLRRRILRSGSATGVAMAHVPVQ